MLKNTHSFTVDRLHLTVITKHIKIKLEYEILHATVLKCSLGLVFPTLLNILTGSVNMVRRCETNASTARELKVAPFSSEYQKLLLGNNMTKFTTNSAYNTRNQVMVAHTIPQLS